MLVPSYVNDIISIPPVRPIPITPPPPLATFALTPDGVIVQLPAPLDVTTNVPKNPLVGAGLNVSAVTFAVCVAVWFGLLVLNTTAPANVPNAV